MPEKSIVITIKCDHCGAIQDFEIIVEREKEFAEQLICGECGWNVARVDVSEVNNNGKISN